MNGLYDAKLDHQPVVALLGQQKRYSIGADYQQEVDLNTLFKDVAAYITTVTHPAAARHAIDRAVRVALADRSVAAIIFPEDVQEEDAVEAPPRTHGVVYSSIGFVQPEVLPPRHQILRAAEVLNEAEKGHLQEVAFMVRKGGVEPPQPCGRWNLNPARGCDSIRLRRLGSVTACQGLSGARR